MEIQECKILLVLQLILVKLRKNIQNELYNEVFFTDLFIFLHINFYIWSYSLFEFEYSVYLTINKIIDFGTVLIYKESIVGKALFSFTITILYQRKPNRTE